MNRLRGPHACSIFALLAGITFLNMSFILAEFDALGLSMNSPLIQSIINSGIEEEKETSSESGEGDPAKEVHLFLQHTLNHYIILFQTGQQRNKALDNFSTHAGYKQNFSPPPEFTQS